MSRTSTTVGRRQSIPAWMTAAAVMAVLALALVWRAVPASADTAPAATPTVAPTATTVATVAPTTAATVAPTAVASPAATIAARTVNTAGGVSTRGRVPSSCAPAGASDPGCYMELALVPEATPTGDTGWRVGDVIKVDLVVKNVGTATDGTQPGTFNGIETYIDLDLDKLELVQYADFSTVTTDVTWDASNQNSGGGFLQLQGDFGLDTNATGGARSFVFDNKYTKVTSPSNLGLLNLEIGSAAGEQPWTVAQGNTATVTFFFVRIKANPATDSENYGLVLRDSNQASYGANDARNRNSIIANAASIGTTYPNILKAATDASLTVKQTVVSLQLVPRLVEAAVTSPYGPSSNAINDRRVGDIIPVDLVLTARTNVRYMDAIAAMATFKTSDFAIVQGATNRTEVVPSTGSPVFLDEATFLLGSNAGKGAYGANIYSVSSGTGTVEMRVSGASLGKRNVGDRGVYGSGLFLTQNSAKVVGRFYVRPKYNGAPTATGFDQITLAAGPQLGVLRSGSWALDYQSTVKI
ncbi:MAG: hypothetical protein KGS10_16965, partial [Chloroflexi bacterium]|nr:hypothetical protein [Chloroflexota bacterium]